MGEARVICGDALAVLRTLADASVAAVVTDPPYFLPAQHYAARKEWPRSLADLSVLEHFYRDVFAEVRRVLVPRGHCLFFCDAQSYPVFYVVAYRHFTGIAALVWDKGKIGLGAPWRNAHELILACTDSGAELFDTQGTIIRCPVVPSVDREHPAEKPIELLRRIVALTVPVGGTVLDPFCGSGTTGIAAVAEGRSFIGIEAEAAYVEVARSRIGGRLATPEVRKPQQHLFPEVKHGS